MKTLQISKDLSLPLDTVTQTIAILAKRRAGKSYTMRRLVEQLFRAEQQVVLVDPKGDQWGIRSAADGKGPGLPIVILGGERGDVPLEPSGGEVAAKLVVEERVSVLLDLSPFRKREVSTFMTAFLENLYRLKAREEYRTPIMLVIDEADAIAPQKPQDGEERMLGAAEDIVRRGGQRGIGCVLVTQRSAVLNKNVLTQAQILVALRTIAPQDLKAMNAWVDVHGTQEQRKTLMDSLPSLPTGDAWFWSPGWPTNDGIFKRVHVLPIETFDSGATPRPGEKPIKPKRAADVDLAALKERMAATIEKTKAEDPKELQRLGREKDKRIAELERKLKSSSEFSERVKTVEKVKCVEVPCFDVARAKLIADELTRIEKTARRQLQDIAEGIAAAFIPLRGSLAKGAENIPKSFQAPRATVPPARPSAPSLPRGENRRSPLPASPGADSGSGDGRLPDGERKILTAIVQHGSVTRTQLTVLTGYKRSSRDTYLQRLRSRGFIEISGENVEPSQDGCAALPEIEPLPEGAELLDYWKEKLPEGERKVLEAVVSAWPSPVDREAISTFTGYRKSSRDTYIQRLKSRQLVRIVGRGEVIPAAELFS